jgi:hypothetical protein
LRVFYSHYDARLAVGEVGRKEATIGFLFGSYLSFRCLFARVIIDNADYEQMNIKQCLKNVHFLCATATAQAKSNDLKCKIFCIWRLPIRIFDLFYLAPILKAIFCFLRNSSRRKNFHDLLIGFSRSATHRLCLVRLCSLCLVWQGATLAFSGHAHKQFLYAHFCIFLFRVLLVGHQLGDEKRLPKTI